jgi:hypothetical protein
MIDIDGDGYLPPEDCDNNDPDVNPGVDEICSDGIDNDCDMLIDGDDPDCQAPPAEVCNDGIDNDGDGLIDCADPDCFSDPNCGLRDGDFELGPADSAWIQYSTNFETVVDSAQGHIQPHGGTYFAWFSYIQGAEEEAWVEQSCFISTTASALSFWLSLPTCGSFYEFFTVSIDGNIIYSTDNDDLNCDEDSYHLIMRDISDYADGMIHTIRFYGWHSGSPAPDSGTSFLLDDVSIQ